MASFMIFSQPDDNFLGFVTRIPPQWGNWSIWCRILGISAPAADDGLHLFITHDIKTDQHSARGDGTTAAGQIIEPSEDMLLLKYLTFRVKFKHFPKIDSDIINGQF